MLRFNDNNEVIREDDYKAITVGLQRKEDISKAYFQCHTDITIPYEELAYIKVVTKDGEEIYLLENGKFTLSGTEILNEPLCEL